MKKIAALISVALVAAGLHGIAPGAAAQDQATVKVALTDMSASAGMGPMGQWMMGPGYGGGQGMMGNGMMRPGYGGGMGMMGPGYGWGSGMMGPGYGAGGMMGQNMMMGMMAIRIDHDTIKAGTVKIDVTNWSRFVPHEALVVAVDDPTSPLPYDYSQAKVKEDQLKILGDTSELQPNESRTLDLTLSPGTYLIICNVQGHYAGGMATPLRVTP